LKAVLIAALLAVSGQGSACATEYLSAGEMAAIGGSSAALLGAGLAVASFDSSRQARWTEPLPAERCLQRLLGGRYYPDKSNLFNRRFGGTLVPTVGLAAIATADLAWPANDRGRDAGQDLFLFATGLMALEGATGITKGLVRRARPALVLEPELATRRARSTATDDRRSFFSGHTASAFFAMTFANKRVRSTMYRELERSQYRSWRWLPPTVAYGLATAVGWSRIAAYEHFVSDVAVGALVGWLMAELFYSFGSNTGTADGAGSTTPLFISIRLPL
jgi:membrane-associated phospholipid phosphatase